MAVFACSVVGWCTSTVLDSSRSYDLMFTACCLNTLLSGTLPYACSADGAVKVNSHKILFWERVGTPTAVNVLAVECLKMESGT